MEDAEWFVRFIRVRVVGPVEFEAGQSGFELGNNEEADTTVGLTGTGTVRATVLISPIIGTRLSEVHTGFIQNLLNQPQCRAEYEWISGGGAARAPLVVDDPSLPNVPGPWIDCGRPEWDDVQDVRNNGDSDSFPFYFRDDEASTLGSAERPGQPDRNMTMSDTPGAVFRPFLDNNRNAISAHEPAATDYWVIRRISGAMHFQVAIAARTKDAPFTFIVIHRVRWGVQMNVNFHRTQPREDYVARYKDLRNISNNTLADVQTLLLGNEPLPVPKSADDARFEIYGPNTIPDDDDD